MDVALAALITAAGMWLVVFSWRRRIVLGGVAGVLVIALVAFAAASGLSGGAGVAELVLALVFLIVGGGLYALGQAFERLLDDDRQDRTP